MLRSRVVWRKNTALIVPALHTVGCRSLATKRPDVSNEAEFAAARQWLSRLDAETIPRDICDVSFSRSSGPGGQNVNKSVFGARPPICVKLTGVRVSSKATIRIPLSSLLPRVPEVLHPAIISSRYHAAKSDDIVIQADDSRKQNDNVNACFKRLHELILQAARDTVPGETSPEQTRRVEQLQKAEAAGRRRMKEFHSNKKTARRSGGRGDD